jgi:Asp-tRNA(Asn)/Glu-tRNA(Gln) amidotransferase A subunit family amidase
VSEVLDLPLGEQAAAIASGDIDSAELLDATLARIEARNPAINAVVETFPERSREMLAAAPDGPLRGVPVVIKDEWPLPWRAQRFGAADVPGADFVPGESGPYRAMRGAGAVVVGVGNMHELGAGSTGNLSVYGPARNPWDTARCPGGSSSGPASAVAGGLVAGSVGADGLGSVRFPAAYCGLTGLKPTFGRAALDGHHMAFTKLIVAGPLAADAADCRLLSGAMFGEKLAAGDASGLRIGLVRDVVSEDVTPEVRDACDIAIEQLRAETGGEVREIELPSLDAATLAAVLLISEDGLNGVSPRRLNRLDPELSPLGRATLKYRMLLPAAATVQAARVRTLMRRRLATLFEQVDVIAWPTIPAPAPPLDSPVVELPSGHLGADQANVRGAALANLTGIPSISVPVGLSTEGLPLALQLQAAWGRDDLLLDAAEALERANGRRWVEARSPLAAAEPAEA